MPVPVLEDGYRTVVDPQTGLSVTLRPSGDMFAFSPGTYTSAQKQEIVNLQTAADKVKRSDQYSDSEKTLALAEIEHKLSSILPAVAPDQSKNPNNQFARRTFVDPSSGHTYDLSNPQGIKDITADAHKPPSFKDFAMVQDQIRQGLQSTDALGNVVPADEQEVMRRTQQMYQQYRSFVTGNGQQPAAGPAAPVLDPGNADHNTAVVDAMDFGNRPAATSQPKISIPINGSTIDVPLALLNKKELAFIQTANDAKAWKTSMGKDILKKVAENAKKTKTVRLENQAPPTARGYSIVRGPAGTTTTGDVPEDAKQRFNIPTATQLRKKGTLAAYEQGKKLGYWN